MPGSFRAAAALIVSSLVLITACAPAAPNAPGTQPTAAPAASQPTAGPAAPSTPHRGGTLVVAFNADPETLDPHISTALLASRVLALIHDNLINRDYDGSFKPGLAEKWDVSPDGKVYTFT